MLRLAIWFVVMAAGLLGVASAQVMVVTGELDVPGPINPDFSVTVYEDGTIVVEDPFDHTDYQLEWWQLPPGPSAPVESYRCWLVR